MSQLAICLGLFVLTIIGYCTSFLSLGTVSMASFVALILTGCLTAKEGLAYFSNNNVIMIASMCVVAAGFNRTQFCTNLANSISKVAKGSVVKLMFGYVIIGVLLSQFIQSPVVVFGIVAPMLIASADSMGLSASKVVFPVGVATIVTCCTLPMGAGATVAAELNGYIESYGYLAHTVGIMDPMKARLPLMIICILYCGFVGVKLSPEKPVKALAMNLKTAAAKEPLKPVAEYAGIIIFFGDALLLMFGSKLGLDSWLICLIGAVLMVMFKTLTPREATSAIPVSMLILIVGALAMSGALAATGAGELIGGHIAGVVTAVGGNSYIVGLIFFIIPFFMTQVMSNRGTMMIFHPIAIATCASIGGNPVGLMILIQAACLSAYMTPMATAAVPYIMDCGGYDQKSMIKQGMPLAAICCVVSVLWIMTIYPIM